MRQKFRAITANIRMNIKKAGSVLWEDMSEGFGNITTRISEAVANPWRVAVATLGWGLTAFWLFFEATRYPVLLTILRTRKPQVVEKGEGFVDLIYVFMPVIEYLTLVVSMVALIGYMTWLLGGFAFGLANPNYEEDLDREGIEETLSEIDLAHLERIAAEIREREERGERKNLVAIAGNS